MTAIVSTSAADPFAWVQERAEKRTAAGLRRQLRPRPSDSPLLDLAGNDYLGLSRHPDVIADGIAALQTWGAGSTGSRLVTGSTQLHAELESALAAHTGAAAALVFSSGYTANLGALTALSGPDTLVVSDERNHASIVDACRLSRAEIAITAHADAEAVEKVLAGRPAGMRALIVTDSVFSADGDLAPLAELSEVALRTGAGMLVDEAHALGAVGPAGSGAVAAAGLAGAPHIVQTVTLSKALGSQGGAVLGPAPVIAHLIDTARSFIFDTGLAPASVGSALGALKVLQREPWRATRVTEIAAQIAEALGAPAPASAVVSIVIGEPERALAAAAACERAGVLVGCFRPPSVPEGTSRLRVAARTDLTDAEIRWAITVVSAAIAAAS